MDSLIVRTWIIIILLRFANCRSKFVRNVDVGCSSNFDETECVYNLYCRSEVEEIDISYSNYDRLHQRFGYTLSDRHCEQRYVNYGGNSLYPMNIWLKDDQKKQNEEVPKFIHRGYNGIPLEYYMMHIYRLDLSGNDYVYTPLLKEMANLKFLNLSKNFITTAKLYNPSQLLSLNEIDLSYNTINKIEVEKPNCYKELSILNISNNYLVEIPDAIFDSFDKLETLDLSHNFIDTLSIFTFEGSKKLNKLYLSHNRITDINYSLFRFNELQILDLSHNRIEKIKLADFEKLIKLEILDLSSNSILNIEKAVFYNMAFLKSVKLHDNKLIMIDKELFLNASSLEKLDISKNNIESLPIGLFKGKNLTMFIVNGNSLKGTLSKGLFEGLYKVERLDLSNQQLTAIDDYAFLGLESITKLLLNNNKLQYLSKNSFKTLNRLITLDLSDNNITDINIDTQDLISLRLISFRNNFLTHVKINHFQNLNSLNFLDLSNNKIINLESNSFNSLSELINFEVSNNPLSGALAENTFNGLQSLPTLVISGTQLTTFKNGSFTGMTQLKEFNASHSKLSVLEYNSFIYTGSLEIIDLSYNQLTIFNINATGLYNLNILFLNNNLLKTVYSSTFKDLPRLTNINLSNNNIKTIDVKAFDDQTDLDYLNIAYNKDLVFDVSYLGDHLSLHHLILSGIKSNINFTLVKENQVSDLEISYSGFNNVTLLDLKHLTHLENVILKNNDIGKLEQGAFTNLNYLTKLDLSYNRLTYIQPGIFKYNKQLKYLNISHNRLADVSYGIFRGLNHLSTLDMSYNNIKSLETERFYEVQSLSVLIVDHNNIEYFDAEEFAGTVLRILSIGENPIPCELLVSFKKKLIPFVITAIKLDESNDENIDGVTCSANGFKYNSKQNISDVNKNERLLIDIRDTLIKIANQNVITESSERKDLTEPKTNLTNEIQRIENVFDTKLNDLSNSLNNTSISILKESSSTNLLLDKILKSLNRINFSSPRIPVLQDNITEVNDLVKYIKNLKQELENNFAVEKQNILDEVEKRMSVTATEVSNSIKPAKDKLLAEKENKEGKSLFTETCVALILFILVCFVLYKFYNSRMFVRTRRSYSTRELPDAMESQDL